MEQKSFIFSLEEVLELEGLTDPSLKFRVRVVLDLVQNSLDYRPLSDLLDPLETSDFWKAFWQPSGNTMLATISDLRE